MNQQLRIMIAVVTVAGSLTACGLRDDDKKVLAAQSMEAGKTTEADVVGARGTPTRHVVRTPGLLPMLCSGAPNTAVWDEHHLPRRELEARLRRLITSSPSVTCQRYEPRKRPDPLAVSRYRDAAFGNVPLDVADLSWALLP